MEAGSFFTIRKEENAGKLIYIWKFKITKETNIFKYKTKSKPFHDCIHSSSFILWGKWQGPLDSKHSVVVIATPLVCITIFRGKYCFFNACKFQVLQYFFSPLLLDHYINPALTDCLKKLRTSWKWFGQIKTWRST